MRLVAALPWAGALSFLVAACGRGSASRPEDGGVQESRAAAAGDAPVTAFDVISGFDSCSAGFDGLLLDLGDPSNRARLGPKFDRLEVESVEREGATWARIRERRVALDLLVQPGDLEGQGGSPSVFIEARARGLAARTMSVYVDGKLVGTAPLPKGEARVLSISSANIPVPSGHREVLLRFSGAPKGTSEPFAEIDWIHIGTKEADPRYAAPTRADVVSLGRGGGDAVPSLSLRAPGFVRCETWIPSRARVETSIALVGGGEGEAAVRLLRDREEPIVLGSVKLGGQSTAPHDYSWPVGDLGPAGGTLGVLELASVSASKGARIVFGAPRLTLAASPSRVTPVARPMKGAVLVILGEVSTRSLPVYGGALHTPEIDALASAGTTFMLARSASSLASGAVASMLTGLGTRLHTVEDGGARLPVSLTTIADAARQAGVSSAMFTANPMTGAAFGFDRGWSTFEMHGPEEGALVVFERAASWIEAHKTERFLLVVHARGGHPPWDATPDELKLLGPHDYSGSLDASHSAELLSRARKTPASLRLTDADRERAWALYALAMQKHDGAVGRLLQALRSAGLEDETLFVLTADVGVNERASVPFAEEDSLDETALWVPLIVKQPHSSVGGGRVLTPVTGMDVAPTLVNALGLEAPASFAGSDLMKLATQIVGTQSRPLLATSGDRFAMRWDRYALDGAKLRETKLCDLQLEAACVTDVRATYPVALDLLHRAAFDAIAGQPRNVQREPAAIDAATSAALRAWGR